MDSCYYGRQWEEAIKADKEAIGWIIIAVLASFLGEASQQDDTITETGAGASTSAAPVATASDDFDGN